MVVKLVVFVVLIATLSLVVERARDAAFRRQREDDRVDRLRVLRELRDREVES